MEANAATAGTAAATTVSARVHTPDQALLPGGVGEGGGRHGDGGLGVTSGPLEQGVIHHVDEHRHGMVPAINQTHDRSKTGHVTTCDARHKGHQRIPCIVMWDPATP